MFMPITNFPSSDSAINHFNRFAPSENTHENRHMSTLVDYLTRPTTYANLVKWIIKHSRTTREDAEDIAQNALTKALASIQQNNFAYHTNESLETKETRFFSWLLTIAKNEFLNSIRHQNAQARDTRITYSLEDAIGIPKTSDNVFFNAANSEFKLRYERVKREMLEKNPKLSVDFLAFEMHILQELSYQEIANNLQMSVGTVKSKLSRIKSLLKQKLQTYQ